MDYNELFYTFTFFQQFKQLDEGFSCLFHLKIFRTKINFAIFI